jgi:Ca2+-binding EF-hand superfamily protein
MHIEPKDIKRILGLPDYEYNEEVWDKVISEVDTENEGKISFRKFEKIMLELII